jgi:hypothetical protein
MKGYKGFDKDLKCRGMQYAIGETVTHKGYLSLCNQGLHFTEHPLDTWSYYKPTKSRFAEVEADGVSTQTEKDSKRVAQSLTVKAELKIPALVKAAVEFVFNKTKSSPTINATTGDSAHSATTGYSAHSATTGYYAHSATTGNSAHSATTGNSAHSATTGDSAHSATTGNSAQASAKGKHSIAASLGRNGQAKGPLKGWLVLSEIADDGAIKAMDIARVDGKKIKADTFYSLKGGKFVEAK